MSECVVNNEENLWIIKILDSLLMVPEEILRKRKQGISDYGFVNYL